LQPNLTIDERLKSLQSFFEDNEEPEDRDLSALAARAKTYGSGTASRSQHGHRQYPSQVSSRGRFLDERGLETCYICRGEGHHARECRYRHKARKYAEDLRLQDESKEHSSSPSRRTQKRPSKTVKFADQPKAFWSDNDPEDGWTEGDHSDFETDDEVNALITDEVRNSLSNSD
ncbi:hypothetical protein K3495_g17203, partial [Podosphaera aphanis]